MLCRDTHAVAADSGHDHGANRSNRAAAER